MAYNAERNERSIRLPEIKHHRLIGRSNMGTILFLILCLWGKHEAPNDYQVLPLLLSLDTIAAMLLLILLRAKKDTKQDGPPPGE